MKKKIALICLFQISIFALPKKLEVIFLSPDKKASLLHFIQENQKKFLATAEKEKDCVPMGDGCFHPQRGYIEGDSGKGVVEQQEDKPKKVETKNTLESNMIDCKEGYYFDIFCGKAKKEVHGPVDYELWIDTSSSLRRFDWAEGGSHCARRSFVERVKNKCSVEVKTFDTSIKQMGGLDNLCITYGLNDQDRMISWIKDSNSKHLIVVTDIDEASIKMRDFLNSSGAIVHGADLGDFSGTRLVSYAEDLTKACQKKKK